MAKKTAGLAGLREQMEKRYGTSRVTRRSLVKQYDVIPTGSYGLDYALRTGGWVRGRIHELVGKEGSAKTSLALNAMAQAQRAYPELAVGYIDMEQCLSPSELVRLADGRRVAAVELVGENFSLWTSTPEGHKVVEASADFMTECEIFRVKTETGRTLEVNAKHPLFRGRKKTGKPIEIDGWTSVGDLRSGDLLAVPSRTYTQPTPGVGLGESEAFILGSLVGDGSITRGAVLTTPEGEFSDEFSTRVSEVGDKVVKYRDGEAKKCQAFGVTGSSGHGTSHVKGLLRDVGLYGHRGHTKFIPDAIFASPSSSVVEFIRGLYAADGHIYVGKPTKKQTNGMIRIEMDTVSFALAQDLQEILLRIGVSSSVRMKRKAGSKSAFSGSSDLWTVSITYCLDVLRFVDAVGSIPGKPLDAIRERALLISQGRGVRSWRSHGLNPDLRWERIASIELVGVARTVGISVPEHHTYLSTFWEHNTFEWEWAEKMGLDTDEDRFLHVYPDDSEDVSDQIKMMASSGQFSMIVIDSIGGMESKQAFEKDAGESVVGRNAQVITRMTKRTAVIARQENIAILVINQFRSNIGSMSMKDQSAGPKALKYATTTKVEVSPTGEIKTHKFPDNERPEVVAKEFRARVTRNKLAAEGKVASFWLNVQEAEESGPIGIDQAAESLAIGLQTGVVEQQPGGYYMMPWTKTPKERIRGRDSVLEFLRDNTDRAEEITKLATQTKASDLVEESEIEITDEEGNIIEGDLKIDPKTGEVIS